MFELIAQGSQPEERWRRRIPEDTVIEIGRQTRPLSVGWDRKVSRKHILVEIINGRLKVQKLDVAVNPVFYHGVELKSFYVSPGEHFVVGDTKFSFTNDQVFVSLDAPNPIRQKTFSAEYLRNVRYEDADQRISVLNQLPQIIGNAVNERELLSGLTNLLMNGISTATAIAIVREIRPTGASDDSQQLDAESQVAESDCEIDIMSWDRRLISEGSFQPSGPPDPTGN